MDIDLVDLIKEIQEADKISVSLNYPQEKIDKKRVTKLYDPNRDINLKTSNIPQLITNYVNPRRYLKIEI